MLLFKLLLVLNWLIALFWIWRTLTALRNLPRVPDILDAEYARPLPETPAPLISVIVPGRNEEQEIEATLRSLLAIEGLTLEIFAVNDRSTDATGAIMERVAAEARNQGKSIHVLHITDLPEGWMGKTHAMALAARQATAPWLLFTDADVLFAKDSLLRAMNLASKQQADHIVIFPTLILESFGERMMISIFQGITAIFSRMWMISDPKSRDALGVGAFNLIRAEAYRAIGGFESLRMEVVEDLRLGVEVKRKGYRQCAAFGRDLIRIRWIVGAMGFVRNVTKNVFAVFRFRTFPALIGTLIFAILCLGPFAALAGPRSLRFPAACIMVMLLLLYRYYRRFTRIPAAYAFTFPIAACVLLYAIVRSIATSLVQGGIRWRGTFYPLAELRKFAGPVR